MSVKNYKIAVFDLDGTLLDTTEGVIAAVKYTISEHKLPSVNEDVLQSFIGPPIQDSFNRVYGLQGDILQDLATTFRNRYKDHELLKAYPYENIYHVMDALLSSGVKIAVATYKRQDYTLTILKNFGFDKYSEILNGADHENKLKKVDIIKKCMEDLGETDYSQAVMIGDSHHDALGAESIGMDFIGVTYGFGFKSKSDVLKYKAIGSADTTLNILDYFK